MPVRLVCECVDVDPPRRRFSGDALPPTLRIRMSDSDLKAIGRKPSRVIEVLVAVAASATWTLRHDVSAREVADDGVRPGIFGSRVLTDIRDVAPVWRNEDILIRGPDIGRHRLRFNPMLT